VQEERALLVRAVPQKLTWKHKGLVVAVYLLRWIGLSCGLHPIQKTREPARIAAQRGICILGEPCGALFPVCVYVCACSLACVGVDCFVRGQGPGGGHGRERV